MIKELNDGFVTAVFCRLRDWDNRDQHFRDMKACGARYLTGYKAWVCRPADFDDDAWARIGETSYCNRDPLSLTDEQLGKLLEMCVPKHLWKSGGYDA
ncbi:hypothetical protein [Microcystis phage Mae-JY24]